MTISISTGSSSSSSSSAPVLLPARTGEWYSMSGVVLAAGTAAGTAGLLTCHPIPLKAGTTLDRIGVSHNATPTASEVARLGIYSDTGNGYPGALLLDAGTVDLSTAGSTSVPKAATISQTITTSGIYWLACARQGPSALAVLVVPNAASTAPLGLPWAPTSATYERSMGYSQTGVVGALPANFTATVTKITNATATMPLVFVRVQ